MRHSAFSLVELSIVLVILGLLTGGILAGQSLIRAAELRTVTTEMDRYSTATNSFRDKYFVLPGDMPNAYAFWGVAAGCTNADVNTTSAGCNGNGDGAVTGIPEGFRFWQHLALAGLIEGSYSGTSTNTNAVLGTNIPRSKISSAGYQMWRDIYSAQGWTGAGSTDTSGGLRFGTWGAFGGIVGDPNRIGSPVMRCDESWNLDKKMDDGRPGTGIWTLHYSVGTACISTSVRGTAEYVFTTPGNQALIDYRYIN